MSTLDEYITQQATGPEDAARARERAARLGLSLTMDADEARAIMASGQSAPPTETPRLTYSNPAPFSLSGTLNSVGDVLYEAVRPGQRYENVPGWVAGAGTVAGGLYGGVPGAMALGGLGGSIAEVARQKLLGEEPNPTAALLNAVVPMVGEGLLATGARVTAPMRTRFLKPENQDINALTQWTGAKFSAPEMLNSPGLGAIEGGVAKFPLGREPIMRAKARTEDSLRNAIRDFSYAAGSVPDETVRGMEIKRPLQKAEGEVRGVANRLYDRVYQLAGNEPVPTHTTITAVQDLLAKPQSALPEGIGAQANRMLRDLVDLDALKARQAVEAKYSGIPAGPQKDQIIAMETANLPPVQREVNYQYLHDISKKINADLRVPGRSATEYHMLRDLRNSVDADLAAFAAQHPRVGPAAQRAASFHQSHIGTPYDPSGVPAKNPTFGQGSFIQSIMDADPEKVPGMIRTASDAGPLRIALARDPVARETVGKAVTQRMMDASLDTKSGLVDPVKFLRQLEQYTPETRALLYGPQQAQALAGLERVLQRHATVGPGVAAPSPWAAMALPSAIAGAVTGLTTGNIPATGVMMALFSPPVIARALTSETGIRILTKGLMNPHPTAYAITQVLEQLAAHKLTNAMSDLGR